MSGSGWHPVSKIMVTIGGVLIGLGLIWEFGRSWLSPLGRLPGDIVIEKPGFRFYFPWVTGILISLVLSVVAWVIHYFQKK